MTKTLKVSESTYDIVRRLADQQGRSLTEVTDSILGSNVQKLSETVERLSNTPGVKETFDGIMRYKDNGFDYVCNECGHPLDYEDEPEECPWCHAKLDWKSLPKDKSDWGGWVLGGLLLLGLLGVFTKPQRV